MDAMQNDSANAAVVVDEGATGDGGVAVSPDGGADEEVGGPETAAAAQASDLVDEAEPEPGAGAAPEPGPVGTGPAEAAASAGPAEPAERAETADSADPAEMPQPRSAEGDAPSAKGKKRKSAPKPKTAAASKSLVVFRDGKVHYADESVVVLDLDDAAHPDTDVHDVVDKLSELRDALESPGRAEAVALVAELIQAKALA